MATDKEYSTNDEVNRSEEFQKKVNLKESIIDFLKETLVSVTDSVFKKAGYTKNEKNAGEYGDGSKYGAGAVENQYIVTIAGKTKSVLTKKIIMDGKSISSDIEIVYKDNIVEFNYLTTEQGFFRGVDKDGNTYTINQRFALDSKDMTKLKSELKSKLEAFAEKELGYLTSTKIGVADKSNKSTSSVVEHKNLNMKKLTIKELFEMDDENGNEIKTSINERISPELFKSAINVSKERGTDNRTRRLGTLYFNDFIGKQLMRGVISNIHVEAPQQGNYRNVRIEIEKKSNIEPEKTKKSYITYDIIGDLFDIGEDIDKKDARILSLIALKINPNSRYKEPGRYFNIKGLNEEFLKENLDMQFPELNGMTRYQLEKEFNKTTDEISNLRNKYRDFVPEEINVLKLKQDKIYKLLYGDDPTGFGNVGQHLKENFERNKAIASTIINQLGGMGKLNAMTGAYNFVAVDYGVSFKIKNPRANYIKIVVNGKDYYDVEIGRIRGTDYKVLVKEEDVPVENLKSLIEKSTGMYLSLFENTVLDTQTELESEIENRFRPSDNMLSYSDMQDIASEHGVDFEDVLQMAQVYANKRSQERSSDLTYWVKELIDQYGYEHNDEIPDWNIFYNLWKQEGFQEENFWANEQDVRTEFLKQTSDPNQLSLFEKNLSIKKLIENEISEEDNYRSKLEELKSEGKITLSIGQHGMIFMQITGMGFKKPYNNYREAYQHYLESTGVVAEGEYGFDDDFDEGPQPGDAEYHYDMGHKKANNGRDVFANIDWKVFWECLVANREALANGGRLPDNPNFIMYNVGDFTDDDGFLSLDSLNYLENYDLIENNGTYPIIGEDYLDFDKFYSKAKEIWLKDTKINNDPSHEPEPYRSGNEDSML